MGFYGFLGYSQHFLIELNYDQILPKLEKLIGYHDAPISTISYLIHSLLSEEIKSRGFKVSISGTSADEIFTGYYDHFNLHLYEMRNHESFKSHLKNWEECIFPFIRNPYLKNDDMITVKNGFLGQTSEVLKEVTSPFVGIFATQEVIEGLVD